MNVVIWQLSHLLSGTLYSALSLSASFTSPSARRFTSVSCKLPFTNSRWNFSSRVRWYFNNFNCSSHNVAYSSFLQILNFSCAATRDASFVVEFWSKSSYKFVWKSLKWEFIYSFINRVRNRLLDLFWEKLIFQLISGFLISHKESKTAAPTSLHVVYSLFRHFCPSNATLCKTNTCISFRDMFRLVKKMLSEFLKPVSCNGIILILKYKLL